MLGYAAASAFAFAVGALVVRRSWRAMVGAGPASYNTRAWLSALVPFSAIAGLQIAAVQISALVLGLVASPEAVAVFRIATLASDLALLSLFAINTIIAPQLAVHFHRAEAVELEQLIGRANQLNIAFAVIVTLGLAAVGPRCLALAFGEPYLVAYLPMCVLALGHLAGATMGYVATLANMAGRERLTFSGAAFGLALNAGLSLLLCPRYGATGAAVAATVSAVAWRLALALALRRATGIRPWALARDFGPLSSWPRENGKIAD
jgi:O-antigen/teichoic acid export membrane protein